MATRRGVIREQMRVELRGPNWQCQTATQLYTDLNDSNHLQWKRHHRPCFPIRSPATAHYSPDQWARLVIGGRPVGGSVSASLLSPAVQVAIWSAGSLRCMAQPSVCNSASPKQPAILISFAHDTFVCAPKLNVGFELPVWFEDLPDWDFANTVCRRLYCILVGRLWNNGLNWDIVLVHVVQEQC